jgi:hypothetical protein
VSVLTGRLYRVLLGPNLSNTYLRISSCENKHPTAHPVDGSLATEGYLVSAIWRGLQLETLTPDIVQTEMETALCRLVRQTWQLRREPLQDRVRIIGHERQLRH